MVDKLSEFIRKKRGNLSLRDFAKLCGNISHTQIDSIERGVDPRTNKPVRPTIDTLKKLALGTGATVAYLAALAADEEFNTTASTISPPKSKLFPDIEFSAYDEKIINKFHALNIDNQKEIESLIDFKLKLQNEKDAAIRSTVV